MIKKKELNKASISSINLAIEKPNAWFLSDDDKARLYALNIGLNVMSSTRVLADAAERGEIESKEELADALYELKIKNKYPISNEMIKDILKVVKNRIKIKNEKESDYTEKVKNAIQKIEERPTPKHPFELFEIEHGFGWYGLTLPIIEEVRRYNEQNHENPISISQIKEKFGSLRIYLSHEPEYLHKMILKADHESSFICEICGARGKNEPINGWYMTLCDDHRNAKLKAEGDRELADKIYKESLDIRNYGWKTSGGDQTEENQAEENQTEEDQMEENQTDETEEEQ